MAAAPLSKSDVDDLTCPVCKEIFEKPVQLPCQHLLCYECLKSYYSSKITCPVCRMEVTLTRNSVRYDKDLEDRIKGNCGICTSCDTVLPLRKMKEHNSICLARTSAKEYRFKPIADTKQPVPMDVPNRCTFTCPYCGIQNLDSEDLVQHCTDVHTHCKQDMVCPICASMPWGEQDMKSICLIDHLIKRHKFEYDTYVNYEQDDKQMLEAAIQASLKLLE